MRKGLLRLEHYRLKTRNLYEDPKGPIAYHCDAHEAQNCRFWNPMTDPVAQKKGTAWIRSNGALIPKLAECAKLTNRSDCFRQILQQFRGNKDRAFKVVQKVSLFCVDMMRQEGLCTISRTANFPPPPIAFSLGKNCVRNLAGEHHLEDSFITSMCWQAGCPFGASNRRRQGQAAT